MLSTSRFGCHMGNSTISLSILKEEKVEIVASKFGDRVSHACLAAVDHEEYNIGLPAKQGIARNESLTVVNNFQFLNEDLAENEIQEAAKVTSLCKLNTKPLEYHLEKGDDVSVKLTPYQVAVKLLTNCYENASHAAKSEERLEVVVAVPPYWSEKSRARYCDAINQSGFDVLQVLTEPSAALLAYDVGVDASETSTVLVVRLGGLSSDFSILSVANGLYTLVDNVHVPQLGGNILTKVLADYLAHEFCNKWKLDPRESRRTMVKLLQYAENCKHVLSTMPSSHIFIESLMDGIDWSQNISRARFENVIAPKISLFVRPIEEFVKKHSNITIDKIIFTGGTMKIPKLQQAISALFSNAQVLNSIPPDETVSIGCGKQALYISGVSWDTKGQYTDMEVNTLSHDVYIEYVADDQNDKENIRELLFSRGALVPSVNKVTITRPIKCVDGKAKIRVIQGDQIDEVERECSADLKEVRARIHHSSESEKPTVHLHLE